MSPHAVLEPVSCKAAADDFAAFGVSDKAFLPPSEPIDELPDPYYQPWERLAAQLPALIGRNTLRDEVQQLPVLRTDLLASEPERQRAYSVLAFVAHGYIWGGSQPAEILPPSLAVPLLAVSKQVELPPVATYAALNLWNYRTSGLSRSSGSPDLDGLTAQRTFTGTVSESWFYMVSVAMEAEGSRMIPAVLRALRAIRMRDDGADGARTAYAATTAALEAVATCVRQLSALLARMHEHCDPDTFYHRIRPFLAGSLGMGHAGLPRGVFYDEGDGRGVWRQLRGGSNGQSSLIQFIDIALGVQHARGGHSSPHVTATESTNGTADKASFHEEVRDYMPGPHRRFLEAVQHMGSLRAFALGGEGDGTDCSEATATATDSDTATTTDIPRLQRRCRAAYNAAVDAMTAMRDGHLQIVARYIVLPSRKPWTGAAESVNLASASSRRDTTNNAASNDERLTGTGGTALMPFLRKARDETVAARTCSW